MAALSCTWKRKILIKEVKTSVLRTVVLWDVWHLCTQKHSTKTSKTPSVSSDCLIVDWLNWVNLSSLWSTLDLGTSRRTTTRNKSFTMNSDWFFIFGAFLDRENRYTIGNEVSVHLNDHSVSVNWHSISPFFSPTTRFASQGSCIGSNKSSFLQTDIHNLLNAALRTKQLATNTITVCPKILINCPEILIIYPTKNPAVPKFW